MNQSNPPHSASYDAHGNVILPGSENVQHEAPEKIRKGTWHTVSDDGSSIIEHTEMGEVIEQPILPEVSTISHRTHDFLHATIVEGEEELLVTEKNAIQTVKTFFRSVKESPGRVTGSMNQMIKLAASPMLGNGKKKKPRSRATLFAFDTIRFGGTFAAIFVFLFVGINYKSFWDIAKAQLALGNDIQTTEALTKLVTRDATNKAFIADPMLSNNDTSVIAYLPPVGPPENRLIIPKLGKNIPITIPSIGSLMQENWKQFEQDVQEALREGVVHYPGTARPGQAGNFFLTGHSSYYPWDSGKFKDVFARLHELAPGDTYSVYYGGDLHMYKVVKTYEVKPTDVSVLDQPNGKRFSTLMTCTPIGTTLRRLIVQAEEIDPFTGEKLDVGERASEELKPAKLDILPI